MVSVRGVLIKADNHRLGVYRCPERAFLDQTLL